MKANELMLGDWVAFRKDFPDRVNAIAIGGHAVSLEHDSWQQMSSIRPIPITTEILLENFPSTKDGVLWWKDEDGIHIESEFDGDIIFSGIFHYVHQLQHALRLAEIEKEIVL